MFKTQILKICLLASIFVMGACGRDSSQDTDLPSVVKGVNFVGMSVKNLQQSTQLYSSTMDLNPVKQWPASTFTALDQLTDDPNNKISMNLMKSANAQILFMQFENRSEQLANTPPVEVFGPGIAHLCFQVNKETQAYDKFLAAGSKHIGDRNMVQLNPKNPVEYAYATDPNGSIVEIEHVDVAALNLPKPPENNYRIRQVAFATPDIGRLSKFYAKFLNQPKFRRAGRLFPLKGEKVDRVSGLPDSKLKMAWFQTHNLEIEMIEFTSHPTEQPENPRPLAANGYNMIVFDVFDLSQASEQFEKAGGTLVTQPAPFLGADIVFGRDPDGNLIGLQASSAGNVISSENFDGNGT